MAVAGLTKASKVLQNFWKFGEREIKGNHVKLKMSQITNMTKIMTTLKRSY